MKKLILGAVAVAGALGSVNASAASVSSSLYYPLTLLQDDSAEYWKDVDGDKTLSVGDILRGVLEFSNLQDPINGNPARPLDGSTVNALHGIFETVVSGVTNSNGTTADFSFTYSSSFAAEFGLINGAAVALWENSTILDIGSSVCGPSGTIAGCEDKADNGVLWASFGWDLLTGDSDEYWFAKGSPLNPLVGALATTSDPLGSFKYGLSFLDNPNNIGQNGLPRAFDAPATVGDGRVDLTGNGTLYGNLNAAGTAPTSPYLLRDDAKASFAPVPEPSILALMGIGLAGFGATKRRKI